MALTKEAAAQAYELGVSMAVEAAGLDKTAADPGKLQAIMAAIKGLSGKARGGMQSFGKKVMDPMSHPALSGAAGGGALGAGGTALGGGDIGDILAGGALGAGAGAGLGMGAKSYMAGRMGKGFQQMNAANVKAGPGIEQFLRQG